MLTEEPPPTNRGRGGAHILKTLHIQPNNRAELTCWKPAEYPLICHTLADTTARTTKFNSLKADAKRQEKTVPASSRFQQLWREFHGPEDRGQIAAAKLPFAGSFHRRKGVMLDIWI